MFGARVVVLAVIVGLALASTPAPVAEQCNAVAPATPFYASNNCTDITLAIENLCTCLGTTFNGTFCIGVSKLSCSAQSVCSQAYISKVNYLATSATNDCPVFTSLKNSLAILAAGANYSNSDIDNSCRYAACGAASADCAAAGVGAVCTNPFGFEAILNLIGQFQSLFAAGADPAVLAQLLTIITQELSVYFGTKANAFSATQAGLNVQFVLDTAATPAILAKAANIQQMSIANTLAFLAAHGITGVTIGGLTIVTNAPYLSPASTQWTLAAVFVAVLAVLF